jgi:hypothetical protein
MSAKQQTIKIITDLMKINNIKLEDLIKFIDLNDVKPSTELIKPKKSSSFFTPVSGKWGDEEVGLCDKIPSEIVKPSTELVDSWSDSDDEVETDEVETEVKTEVETEVKTEVKTEVETEVKTEVETEVKTEVETEVETEVKTEVKTEVEPEVENTTWKHVVTKKLLSNPDKVVSIHKVVNSKQKFYKSDKKEIVSNLSEFINAVKQRKKLYIDFEIDPHAHCTHTFNGTLCSNVIKCGKIHLQRCIRNLDCTYKNCPYLHISDMPDDEAKEKAIDSINRAGKTGLIKLLMNLTTGVARTMVS